MNFALVLDVDGVLYKDFKPIPGAIETLNKLGELKIPHIFLTNSTGQTESYKRKQYEDLFNIKIDEEQVIMAHTPLGTLDHLKEKRILVIGAVIGGQRETALNTLKIHGYKNLTFISDFVEKHKYLFPYRGRGNEPEMFDEEPFAAIIVIKCPDDWHSSIQACIDILTSDGHLGTKVNDQVIPIHFCNPDLVYSGLYHEPRLTEGSFREALTHIYKLVTKKDLIYHVYGKPMDITYDYAKKILQGIATRDGHVIKRVYAIGDNPESDICGANKQNWYSILVQTGLYKENHDVYVAKAVCKDVKHAFEHIMEVEREFK